ncbi:LAMI_0C09296g1_1 [Lachancea mirantina]|uniref:LAMI_0C09296g1_1 n=1 Tax=Lachancea mirantina TaxID=1230905 RepID=A0A1G4J5D8_9SACH|nr:LAMI_0C09296g1_1 [Lachancea mirantina]
MGYIQFDKEAVPADNLVPLDLLSAQLAKQRREQERCAWQPQQPQELLTRASLTSAVGAEVWALLWGMPVCGPEFGDDLCTRQQISLDEETCGMRLDTTAVSAGVSDEASLTVTPAVTPAVTPGESPSAAVVEEGARCSAESCEPRGTVAVAGRGSGPHEFQCAFCPSSFRVKSYLTRHAKKHALNKEFRCPFRSRACKCHATGEFSRRDSLKMHLKSIHFVYPVGTSRAQYNRSPGRCAACFQEFDSSVAWLATHVEPRACPALTEAVWENCSM